MNISHKNLIYLIVLKFFLFHHQSLNAQKISFFQDTIYACKEDTITLSIPSEILSKSVNIQWITPNSIIYHSSMLKTYQEGQHIVKLKTKQFEISDTFYILKSEKPNIIIQDTIMCMGKSILIRLNHPLYKFYLPESKIPITQMYIHNIGKYSLKIDNRGCSVIRQFEVKSIQPSVPEHKEYTFCVSDENKKISVKHNGISNILWSNGSDQKSIIVDREDNYWVKISDRYCGTKIDTIVVKFKPCNCEILVPNSFTPNEDGKNDYFYPILSCEYSYYNLTIYDKWNNVVFSTNNPNAKWDGRYKGNLLPEDVYVYKIETIEKNTDKKNSRTGKVALIR